MREGIKLSKLDLYNNRHHIIYIQRTENVCNDYFQENNTNLNGNSLKMLDAIGSSYLVTDNNRKRKPKTMLQKIKNQNDMIKKQYFYNDLEGSNKVHFATSFNEERIYNDNDIINKAMNNKKKKKRSVLKNSSEEEEIINFEYFMINSEKRRKKIENKKEKKNSKDNKITNIDIHNCDKLKEILKRKNYKKYQNETNKNKLYKNSQNSIKEDIYIYNGCDNFLVKDQLKKNLLNSTTNILSNVKLTNYKKMYMNNINSMKNLALKNVKNKTIESKIYHRKIPKSSLSLKKNFPKEKNQTYNSINNINNYQNIKVEKCKPLLNENNKKYFKINNNPFLSNSTNNNSEMDSYTSKKPKVYKKPNLYIQKSYKSLNSKNNNKLFDTTDMDSCFSHEFDKGYIEKKIKIKNIQFNRDESIDIKTEPNKQNYTYANDLNTKEFNDENINSNTFNPKISIDKIKISFQNFNHTIQKDGGEYAKDNLENSNNKFIYLNSKRQAPIVFNFKKNENLLTHLPISEYSYFTKENKIIMPKDEKALNNELESNILEIKTKKFRLKTPKIHKDLTLNNNYIPIKAVKEKHEPKKIPIMISKDMIEKLNKKTEKNKYIEVIRSKNKKHNKESFSIDCKRANKNNDINEIFKNNEEINNEKNKRYKIRSVVKVIKKNKDFNLNILNEKNISKDDEKKIIEEIKKSPKKTKQDEIRHDKIKKILKEEIENFISFYNNNFNKNNDDKGKDLKKDKRHYNWSIIEQLIIKIKVDLIDIINSFLAISDEIIDNKDKLKISNEYIKQLIVFYKNNYINENNIKTIQIKMLRILYKIENICINNNYKYEILGNLFYYFLIGKMFKETDLNYLDNRQETFIIELAKVVKFIIFLFSADAKLAEEKYCNFKNTKIFNKNPIYFQINI